MSNCCRLCGADNLQSIIDLGDMPIAHRMLESAEAPEELFPFNVVHCHQCGYAQIEEPIEPAVLYADFNFNFSSWKNEPHLEEEIDWITSARTFSSALDIGCNDGRFLAALRDAGIETCVGIEPNKVPAGKAQERGLQVINKMLDMKTAAEIVDRFGRFDLVTSRQVIEHTLDPTMFLRAARHLLKDDGMLFLDMPDFGPTLQRADVSTLWEEHPGYFTEPTLRWLLAKAGFTCTGVARYDFSGGCLAATAVPAETSAENAGTEPGDIQEITEAGQRFVATAWDYRDRLTAYLERRRNAGATVVLFGVGVRGCTAVNGYGIAHLIDYAVDDQKERQGLFVPGARLEIRPTDTLAAESSEIIALLAVNNENEHRVGARLRDLLGERIETLSLCGPRDFERELQDAIASEHSGQLNCG